ncbi:efflux RND transporter periplasmic adaptor subunit [Parapedobacter tibetensis]|uniref:efflux RND transporter periplasmic adaptor subunit n=1 Tax=Parapedobacter tibetensis TaxID=2972951 RepID=UPI00214DCF00|nr:efflux RND transporter periplasmic adaptor subunit [Parapedobacter tibetensis]
MNRLTSVNTLIKPLTGRWMVSFAVLLLLSSIQSCGDRTERHTVEEVSLHEAVYASGEIFPLEYEHLMATTPERIHQILVREGDTVKAGQPLVILGSPSENEQLGILSGQLAIARQNAAAGSAVRAELQERMALAKKQYEQDSINAQRYTELAITQAVSRKQAEEMAVQAASSLTQYNNLRLQLQSQYNDLQNKVLAAEQQLAQFRQGRESRVLISRIEGKVFSIHKEVGETVNPQEPILMVGSPGKYQLELLVDERDVSKIKLGQQVLFETDAYAGKQFKAQVNKIMPVLQKENRSFEIEALVLDDSDFYPQASVEANIVIRDSSQVLAIPVDYLLPGDSVQISRDGSEQKIAVQTGIRDGELLEVNGGLQKGDVVIKNKTP